MKKSVSLRKYGIAPEAWKQRPVNRVQDATKKGFVMFLRSESGSA